MSVLSDDSFRQNFGCFQKLGVGPQNWMGENHGKPYGHMDDLGGVFPLFLETPICAAKDSATPVGWKNMGQSSNSKELPDWPKVAESVGWWWLGCPCCKGGVAVLSDIQSNLRKTKTRIKGTYILTLVIQHFLNKTVDGRNLAPPGTFLLNPGKN